jgi:hypothetical protein
LTFTITSLGTADNLFVQRGPPTSHHFQNLQFSLNLPRSDQNPAVGGFGRQSEINLDGIVFGKNIALWYRLCQALAASPELRRVDFWLDTLDPRWKRLLARDFQLYQFKPSLAAKATINVPAETDNELQRLKAAVSPGTIVIGREYPHYSWNSLGISPDEFAPWRTWEEMYGPEPPRRRRRMPIL